MGMNDNVFREARAIAQYCTSPERRDRLRRATDACKEEYDLFIVAPSRERMQLLVGTWGRMLIAMDNAGPYVDPSPPAGRIDQRAMAA